MLRVSVATTCWRDPDRHPRLREAAEYSETAEVACLNRADEEAMAEKIAASWDHLLDLTLADAE
jgi:hypothetical protein